MGNGNDSEYRDCAATMDDRGRLTIKEDDRIALGIEGMRALLDMKIRVLKTDVDKHRSDGGEPHD